MTKAQMAILKILSDSVKPYAPLEFNFKSKTRMLEKLVERGLASKYVHGGFEITEAGRAALHSSSTKEK